MEKSANPSMKRICAVLFAAMLLLSGCSKDKETSSIAESSSNPVSSSSQSSSAASSSSEASSVASSGVQSSRPASSGTESKPGSKPSQSLPSPMGAIEGAVPASASVNASYLDDAVFIGDSVTLKLKLYVSAKRKTDTNFFGKAQFLVAGSMGSGNALQPLSSTSIHPSVNGTKMLLEDGVKKIGAKKVYIMLGMNDIGLYGIDASVKNMDTLVGRIKAKTPDAIIMIQSVTPMVQSSQLRDLNNKNIYIYDQKLAALCKQRNYHYIDVGEMMRGKDGALPMNYCSDPNIMGIHFTDTACQVWIQYILTHSV